MKEGKLSFERAHKVAEVLVGNLKPYCHRIEIAGSIRRKRHRVNDIDLVLIPSDPWQLHQELLKLGKNTMSGNKIRRVLVGDIQVDIYFATEETWATLFLIRTGSTQNNIRLCTAAKKRGWHLAASGDGLFDESGERIAGDSERSIYAALGLPYQAPEERE